MKNYFIYSISSVLFFILSLSSLEAQTAVELNKEGEKLFKQKKYNSAVKKYDSSLQKYNQESAKTLHNLGWVQELQGNKKEAVKNYEKAIKRNPRQIHSSERVGALYFSMKKYNEAIAAGERVLKFDPKNTVVLEWLDDAYQFRLEAEQRRLAKLKKKRKKDKVAGQVQENRKKEKKTLIISGEVIARSTYELEGDNDYKYKKTEGYGPDLPHMYYLDFRPVKSFQLSVRTGNPYQGALMPEVIHWMEKVECLFYTGDYFLGTGVLGNHYKSDNIFAETKKLNDYKLGILFGRVGKRSRLYVSLFPRFIPYDAGYSDNKTLDVEAFDLEYEYYVDTVFKIYAKISLNGYYFFDHAVEISHFAGYNDFGIGMSYKIDWFTLSFELTEKLYYLDVNNPEPYKFANGQGMFGVNRSKWFRGDPLSGFETVGHVVRLGFREDVSGNIFVYQNFIAEFVSPSRRGHDFLFQFGLGLAF
jgi:hypothetical protein